MKVRLGPVIALLLLPRVGAAPELRHARRESGGPGTGTGDALMVRDFETAYA